MAEYKDSFEKAEEEFKPLTEQEKAELKEIMENADKNESQFTFLMREIQAGKSSKLSVNVTANIKGELFQHWAWIEAYVIKSKLEERSKVLFEILRAGIHAYYAEQVQKDAIAFMQFRAIQHLPPELQDRAIIGGVRMALAKKKKNEEEALKRSLEGSNDVSQEEQKS